MSDTGTGVPSAAQIITYADPLATMFKNTWANDGIGLSTETTTKAAYAKAARAKILGGVSADGLTVYPGVGHASLQRDAKEALDRLASRSRYDALFNAARDVISPLQAAVRSALPSGWVFTDNTIRQPLDSYLLYLNAMHLNTPATPAAAGVLTAQTFSGGGFPNVTSGVAPYFVHCLVSTQGDYYVSLPSPEATRVALVGSQNGYNYQIPGAIPAGIADVIVFRTLVGGVTGGPYYMDSRTAVTAGASSYPAIPISTPDSGLRQDWRPPAWGSCLMMPEFAAWFALAFAVPSAGGNPLGFSEIGMLSPNNVALEPSSGFLGEGNPPSTGIFATRVVGTGLTLGSIASVNNYVTNTQGFVGAVGAANILQARVTAILNVAGTSTITYTYYDASHGYGVAQSVATAAATFSGTAVGSVATYVIPAGRVVIAVTAETPGGGLTGGTYIVESLASRAY